jgi:hypothetical protein
MANSSSIAITISTASRESKPRSSLNLEVAVTLVGSTLSKFLTTVRIRSWTSAGGRKVDYIYIYANISILFLMYCLGEGGRDDEEVGRDNCRQ